MQVTRVIDKNSRFILSLAEAGGGSMNLIKSYAEDHPSLSSMSQLKNELYIAKKLSYPGLRNGADEVFHNGRKCLLLDYIDGDSIKGQGPLSLSGFFDFALQITKTLAYVHDQGITHRDISSNNIIFAPLKNKYYLIDFGTAIEGTAKQAVQNLVGTPTYTSPELSGRLQMLADQRADIYSLGVVFYEMLLGLNPFEDTSDMQIIYRQLTYIPKAPDLVKTNIPLTLSRIIMKMIQKDPGERYQSSSSILHDLEESELLFKRNVNPTEFFPGELDKKTPYFESPPFVGYADELAALKGHLPNLIEGNCHMHYITGSPGVGKSKLINQLLPSFYEEQVMYILLDTSSNVKPYSFVFELFDRILSRINEESDSRIQHRMDRFIGGNLSNVGILTDKLPALKKFIKKSNNDAIKGSIQAQNRFKLALQDLLRILALPERPIVIHMAKADHIDQESRDFFIDFVSDIQDEYVWILVESSDVADDLLSEKKTGISSISLPGLKDKEIAELFDQMIVGPLDNREKSISSLIKYGEGNPGRAISLIHYWTEHGFLTYDKNREYWYWQNQDDHPVFPESIIGKETIDDPVLRDILEWASIIDGQFSFELISSLSSYGDDEIRLSLEKLNLQSQLISFRPEKEKEYYKLTSSISPGDLIQNKDVAAEKHLAIASYLEAHTKDPFRIAHHLNEARKLGNVNFDQSNALLVNHQAGMQAKYQGAFKLAQNFFQNGLAYLNDQAIVDKDIHFSLLLNTAELAQLSGDHKSTAMQFEEAFKLADSPIQKAEIYTRQLTLLNHQGKLDECLEVGRKALDILGYPIPDRAGKISILRKLIKLRLKLGKSDPLKLVEMPAIEDKKVILALQILEDLHPAIFNKSSDLLAYVILSSFEKVLKFGNSPEGYSAYAGFGAILALGFNNFQKGWEFTLAGTEMTRMFDNKMYHGRGLYSKGGWVIYYVKHMKEGIAVLEEGMQLSKEAGDFTYATFAAMNLMEIHFMLGHPLHEYERKVDEYISFTHQIAYNDILAQGIVSKNYIRFLNTGEDHLQELSEKWFKAKDVEEYTDNTSFKYLSIYHKLLKAYQYYYESRFEEAEQLIIQSEKLKHVLKGPPLLVVFYFVKGLIAFENAQIKGKSKKRSQLGSLRRSIKKLKKYANLLEANFGHRYLILQAFELKLEGHHFKARKKMREAVELTRKHDYPKLEALASRYLAKWFYTSGRRDYARLHYRDAINAYQRFGANYLSELIQKEFEDFVEVQETSRSFSSKSSSSSSWSSTFSNPEVLMQSALSVAAETDIESLLKVMNQIFIEQAGATRSLLFILSQNELGLIYEMDAQNKQYHPFPGKAFKNIKGIPKSIIQWVLRSGKSINIADSTSDQRFSFEPFLHDTDPFSILVIPMTYRGVLSGIIYFENTLLTNAFSTERQELINLLSGQFAVALQNAQLVEELEIRVKERTLALESEKDRSDHLLRNILPAETAEELKMKGKATPKYHEDVSVMFTDFQGFTNISEKLHPEELVKMLDYYFRKFDTIIEKYGLEKIKTIGDAYMCVAGLSSKKENHALQASRAAFEILQFIEETRQNELYELELRIGIHSGPVVAGVVGENKFAFDIWGDTVNTASRMETNSKIGKINITRECMELLKDHPDYIFEYRGKVPAKNKGEIDMYFISKNSKTQLRHQEAIEFILDKLEKGLPKSLSYHSHLHTREILYNVSQIGQKEGIDGDEMILLKTAAAYHDSGFLSGPTDHEEKSCKVVVETLPDYGYNQDQIDQICQMILATKIPQKPMNHLSEILCDADLYYLGTDEFYKTGHLLFNEFKTLGIISNEPDWLNLQISFLESHSYHTKTAIEHCNPLKTKHLNELKDTLLKQS